MITAIRSLPLVNGATLWLLFWVICAAGYLIFCLIKKPSLKRTVFHGLLIAEMIIDLFWTLLYYPLGTYVEHGLAAIFGLLVWIPVLAVTACIVLKDPS